MKIPVKAMAVICGRGGQATVVARQAASTAAAMAPTAIGQNKGHVFVFADHCEIHPQTEGDPQSQSRTDERAGVELNLPVVTAQHRDK
jgi:hypothetical protein